MEFVRDTIQFVRMHQPRGIILGGKRFFGFHTDRPRDRAKRMHVGMLLAHFGAQAIPGGGSLATFRAPIFDQGQTGSCGGHGSAQLTYTAFGAAGMVLPFIPSPNFIYANTRIEELAGPSLALQDTGIAPTDLITALQLYGIRSMLTTPGLVSGKTPDGRQSDVWGPTDVAALANIAANVNDKPDMQEHEEGLQNVIAGEYEIPVGQTGTGGTDDNMASIISITKRPVGVGLFVDSSVMQWKAGMTPIDSINMNDPEGGGHWVSCDSYTTMEVNGLSQRVYEIPNSWGVEYGQNGVVLITARALGQSMSDCIAWTVRQGGSTSVPSLPAQLKKAA